MDYIRDSPWKAYDYVPEEGAEILDNLSNATLEEVRHLVTWLWRMERNVTGIWISSLNKELFSKATARAREIIY